MTSLIFNFIFLSFVSVVVFFKEKRLSPYLFVIILNTIVAGLGVYICINGIYDYSITADDPVPYILSLLLVLIFISPLKHIRYNNLSQVSFSEKYYSVFIFIICFFSIIYCILLYEFFSIVSEYSFAEVYDMKSTEESIRLPNRYLNAAFFSLARLIKTSMPFCFMILFSRLIRTNKTRHLLYIALIAAPYIITQIILSNRGTLFFTIFSYFYFVLIYFGQLSKTYKKVIVYCSVIAIIIVAGYSILITNSRVENKTWTSGTESILHYFGESYPNLGLRVWPIENINHPYGERLFPSLKLWGETDNRSFFNAADRSYYWVSVTNAPVVNFKTMFGDLYVEFGLIWPFILALFTRLLILLINRYNSFFSIALMNLCYNLAIFGLFDFSGESFYMDLFWFVIICQVFNICRRFKVSRYAIT